VKEPTPASLDSLFPIYLARLRWRVGSTLTNNPLRSSKYKLMSLIRNEKEREIEGEREIEREREREGEKEGETGYLCLGKQSERSRRRQHSLKRLQQQHQLSKFSSRHKKFRRRRQRRQRWLQRRRRQQLLLRRK